MVISWHNPFKYLLGWGGGNFCIKDCSKELLTRVFRITANMPIWSSGATLSYIRSRIGSVFIVITVVIILILIILFVFCFVLLPLLSLLFIIIIIYYYYYYYYYFNLTSYIGGDWFTNVKNVVKVSRVTFIKVLQVEPSFSESKTMADESNISNTRFPWIKPAPNQTNATFIREFWEKNYAVIYTIQTITILSRQSMWDWFSY